MSLTSHCLGVIPTFPDEWVCKCVCLLENHVSDRPRTESRRISEPFFAMQSRD